VRVQRGSGPLTGTRDKHPGVCRYLPVSPCHKQYVCVRAGARPVRSVPQLCSVPPGSKTARRLSLATQAVCMLSRRRLHRLRCDGRGWLRKFGTGQDRFERPGRDIIVCNCPLENCLQESRQRSSSAPGDGKLLECLSDETGAREVLREARRGGLRWHAHQGQGVCYVLGSHGTSVTGRINWGLFLVFLGLVAG
jgi:hypothetical protein